MTTVLGKKNCSLLTEYGYATNTAVGRY